MRVAFCDAGGSPEARAAGDEFAQMLAYRRHGPDGGQSAAINEGWRNLDADIFGWLNADDYLAPEALAHVAKIFQEREDVDVVYGQSLILDDDFSIGGLHPAVDEHIELIGRHNLISQPSCFYRRRALESAGYLDERLDYTMDWDLWARLYFAGAKFLHTPQILSSVLWEKGTKTSGLPARRMREIVELAGRYENGFVVAKTAIGFTLHHLFEYSAAVPMLTGFRRLFRGTSAARANIWRADATSPAMARIPVYHFLDSDIRCVSVDLGSGSDATVELNGVKMEAHGESAVEIETLLQSGRVSWMTVTTLKEQLPDIRALKFHA